MGKNKETAWRTAPCGTSISATANNSSEAEYEVAGKLEDHIDKCKQFSCRRARGMDDDPYDGD